MVLINHTSKEMIAKIVYYGPARSGKTTNLIKIYEFLPSGKKGKMLSLSTKEDRTLFFDLLPVEGGKVKSFNLRFQLYTVPGQPYYNETRKLVLKGADAVVFVVDSQKPLLEENKESFKDLFTNLRKNEIDPSEIPIFIQYNKRDCPSALSVEFLKKEIGLSQYLYSEAVAIKGEGVMETYKEIVKLLIRKLKGEGEPIKIKEKKEEEKKLEDTHPKIEEAPIKIEEAPSYDKVEEVNLEKLIDERQRPTVVFVPPEEKIEELSPDYIVEEPEVTVEDTVIQITPSKEEEEEVFPEERSELFEFKEDLNKILDELEKIKNLIEKLIKKI